MLIRRYMLVEIEISEAIFDTFLHVGEGTQSSTVLFCFGKHSLGLFWLATHCTIGNLLCPHWSDKTIYGIYFVQIAKRLNSDSKYVYFLQLIHDIIGCPMVFKAGMIAMTRKIKTFLQGKVQYIIALYVIVKLQTS